MAPDDAIKAGLKVIADLMQMGSDLSGGLSFGEIGDLVKLGQDVPGLISDAANVWPQYSALDDAARADLEAYVVANDLLPANVNIQGYIQKALDALIALSAVAASLK